MKKLLTVILSSVLLLSVLSACEETTNVADKQQQQKNENTQSIMNQTPVPKLTHSLERENIRKRIILTNDPNTLQWIYPISNGRVIGRFPVKGKVTSGQKRLTSAMRVNTSGYQNDVVTDYPDEQGAYGSSNEYIFWFDPAGNIYQWEGDYFVSTVPYEIDKGYGTVTMTVDKSEQAKIDSYNQQIKESNAKGK